MKRFVWKLLTAALAAVLLLGVGAAQAADDYYHTHDWEIGSAQPFDEFVADVVWQSAIRVSFSSNAHSFYRTVELVSVNGAAKNAALPGYDFTGAPEGEYVVKTRFHHSETNVVWQSYNHYITVRKTHRVTAGHTGAPEGYGGVKLNGVQTDAVSVLPGSTVTVEPVAVPGHTVALTWTGGNPTKNGSVYTFTGVNASFSVTATYTASEFATLTLAPGEGVTIRVNGDSAGTVRVIAGIPYEVKITTATGYALTSITHGGQQVALSNSKQKTYTRTSARDETVTISAQAVTLSLEIRPTAAIAYAPGLTDRQIIERIFDAVYLSSGANLTKDDLGSGGSSKPLVVQAYGELSNSIIDMGAGWYTLGLTAPDELLSGKVTIPVRLVYEGVTYSNECQLSLINPNIRGNTPLRKIAGLNGVNFNMANGQDFSWTTSYASSYLVPYAYYDLEGNAISKPTQPGDYYVVAALNERTNPVEAILPVYVTTYSDKIPFTVVEAKPTAITGVTGGKVYDGLPLKLSFTLEGEADGAKMTWSFVDGYCPDYSDVAYKHRLLGAADWTSGLPTAAGRYQVQIIAGDVTETVGAEITPLDIASDKVTVSISPVTGAYNGQPHAVTASGEYAAILYLPLGMVEGRDLRVVCPDDMTTAGAKTITVEGMGNYTGSRTFTYTIMPIAPTAADFAVTLPENPVFDGNIHNAQVEPASGVAGLGGITVRYSATPVNAGTYTVSVDVAAGVNYTAAEDIVLGEFTIDKAVPEVDTPTGLTAWYSQTLADVALPEGWAWDDPTTPLLKVGTFTYSATYTPGDTENYQRVTRMVPVVVSKSDSTYGTDLSQSADVLTYGEKLTVTAIVHPAAPVNRSLTAESDQMALFWGDVQLTGAVSAVNGVYTMTYDTADKILLPGTHTLTVRYAGSEGMNGYEEQVELTILRRPLQVTFVEGVDRIYRAGSCEVAVQAVQLGNVIGADDVRADLSGLAATLADDQPGDYTLLTLADPVALTGDHAAYYDTPAGGEYAGRVTIKTVPANLQTRITIDDTFTEENIALTLMDAGFATVGDIHAAMEEAMRKSNGGLDGVKLLDVRLEYTEDGVNWLPAGEEHFPADGVRVTLPLPEGTAPGTHTFSVLHMSAAAETAGELDAPAVKLGQLPDGNDGLTFKLNSLSPVMVGWTAKPVPQTGDGTNALLLLAVMAMVGAALLVLRRRVR